MGKYFDRLCRIAEKDKHPDLVRYLNDAKLFVFPGNPSDFIPKQIESGKEKELTEGFFLPFPTIALEDDCGVVLLHVDPNSEDNTRNIEAFDLVCNQYGYAQLSVMMVDSLKYSGDRDAPIEIYAYDNYAYAALLDKNDDVVRVIKFPESTVSDSDKFRNVGMAFYEVLILNTPDRFVFEIAPTRIRENSKKILRTHDRPIYTLLTPGEIKKRYGMGGVQSQHAAGGGITPHPRRRHRRVLRSDVFKHKQGQTIIIPACWVGPEEKQIGNKIYRVRLDV